METLFRSTPVAASRPDPTPGTNVRKPVPRWAAAVSRIRLPIIRLQHIRGAGRNTSMALKQVQLFVRGRVQGVYFRASTQREARRLGLTGWVKNRPDGSVEIVAEGEEISIRELYGWAQKGPSAARVDRVETRWRSYTGEFPDFRIMD